MNQDKALRNKDKAKDKDNSIAEENETITQLNDDHDFLHSRIKNAVNK